MAIIGVVLWNMPQTASLFQGQHTFYNASQIPCEKCHADIADLLINSPSEHETYGCKGCHTRDGNESHAAKIVSCNDCHLGQHSALTNPNMDCRICHESHGKIIEGIPHGNGLPCLSCHVMHR